MSVVVWRFINQFLKGWCVVLNFTTSTAITSQWSQPMLSWPLLPSRFMKMTRWTKLVLLKLLKAAGCKMVWKRSPPVSLDGFLVLLHNNSTSLLEMEKRFKFCSWNLLCFSFLPSAIAFIFIRMGCKSQQHSRTNFHHLSRPHFKCRIAGGTPRIVLIWVGELLCRLMNAFQMFLWWIMFGGFGPTILFHI